MPSVLIYVSDPLHLQLLSIRLYNISPIVQHPALSALPRFDSRASPIHNHMGAARGGGVGGTDRTEQEIEEVVYNTLGEGERQKRWNEEGVTEMGGCRRKGREGVRYEDEERDKGRIAFIVFEGWRR